MIISKSLQMRTRSGGHRWLMLLNLNKLLLASVNLGPTWETLKAKIYCATAIIPLLRGRNTLF